MTLILLVLETIFLIVALPETRGKKLVDSKATTTRRGGAMGRGRTPARGGAGFASRGGAVRGGRGGAAATRGGGAPRGGRRGWRDWEKAC